MFNQHLEARLGELATDTKRHEALMGHRAFW